MIPMITFPSPAIINNNYNSKMQGGASHQKIIYSSSDETLSRKSKGTSCIFFDRTDFF